MPSNSASVHTQGWLWRRDFYDGAKLRRADLKSGECHTSDEFCALLFCSVNTYSARRGARREPTQPEVNI